MAPPPPPPTAERFAEHAVRMRMPSSRGTFLSSTDAMFPMTSAHSCSTPGSSACFAMPSTMPRMTP